MSDDGYQSGYQWHFGGAFVMQPKALSDTVTQQEMQQELQRLRSAIAVLTSGVGAHVLSQDTMRRIYELLERPEERKP